MYLIGGSTGHLGTAVVARLRALGAQGRIALLARDPVKARAYEAAGLAVRYADYDQPETLVDAFRGISKFLFISTMSLERGPQQARVVEAAQRAGVAHVLYTGLAIRDIAQSAVRPLMESHFETEALLRASGMAWTFLRNGIYAEALPQLAGPEALTRGIALPGGQGRAPFALRAEMGEAIANVLMGEGHEGQIYALNAPQSWSFEEIAAALSAQRGVDLPYRDIHPDLLRQRLGQAGLPEFLIWLTAGTVEDIRAGQYDLPSSYLEVLLGRRPAGLEELLARVFPHTPS